MPLCRSATCRSEFDIRQFVGRANAYSGATIRPALRGAKVKFKRGTVRDLVAGSGLRFEDRGRHVLKGLPEEVQLYTALGV